MILSTSKTRIRHHQPGFTLVELLIVIVVIAILAAITVVAYNGVTNQAKTSAAQASARQAFMKVKTYAVENSDSYPNSVADVGLTDTSDTTYQYRSNNTTNPKTFCLTVTKSNVSYYVSDASSTPTAGACAGHGVNGVVAVTNMIPNPSIETSTTGHLGSRASLSVSNLWAESGASSLKQTPTDASSNDSFSSIGGDTGAIRLGMQANKTYTISGTLRLSAVQTGSLHSRARTIHVFTKTPTTSYVSVQSAVAPNQAGATRLSVTFTIPVDVSEAFIRLYNGALVNGGETWWDSLILTEGNSVINYADGSSPGWIWNGTPNNSTSTGSPL